MKNKNNMLQGNAIKSIIIFSIPILLQMLLQSNYALVDNIIVGRYINTDALAAVGNVGSINSFIVGTAVGLTSGFTIPVAHGFGANDSKKVSHYAGNAIVLSLVVGVTITIIARIISIPLLKLIGTPDNIINLSASYINIIYLGITLSMVSNVFISILRAVGDSKNPLYISIFSIFVNLGFDLLFVKQFHFGVEGAAWASFISQAIVTIVIGVYIFKFNHEINIDKRDIRLNNKTSMEQIKLGIPVSLQFTITSIGSMCMQSAVNSFGANTIAGFAAAAKVENLTNFPMSAMGSSTLTFVGQNYGAKNYKRITDSVKKIFITNILISVLMSLVLYLIGPTMIGLFMKEPNAQMMFAAKHYMWASAECYSMVAILFIMRSTLQGMGFTYGNTVAGAGELVGRIAIAFIFTPLIGFNAVCYAGPVAWVLADIPLIFIYLSKKKKLINLSKQTV